MARRSARHKNAGIITADCSPRMATEVRALARANGMSVSGVIKAALAEFLERRR